MKKATLTAESLTMEFNRRIVFSNISFSVSQGQSMAIVGRNGSGKSTLAKILCGLLSVSKGSISLSVDGNKTPFVNIYRHVGLVSPYINMYEEFSGLENLFLISRIRSLQNSSLQEKELLLKQFGIFDRRYNEVRTYSSGMKQRLKYAAALLHHPEILILDEPTANLDKEGIATVRNVMRSQMENGILLIATNDKEDLDYAGGILDLDAM